MQTLKLLTVAALFTLSCAAAFAVGGGILGFAITTIVAGFTGVFEGGGPTFGLVILGAWVGAILAIYTVASDWPGFKRDCKIPPARDPRVLA